MPERRKTWEEGKKRTISSMSSRRISEIKQSNQFVDNSKIIRNMSVLLISYQSSSFLEVYVEIRGKNYIPQVAYQWWLEAIQWQKSPPKIRTNSLTGFCDPANHWIIINKLIEAYINQSWEISVPLRPSNVIISISWCEGKSYRKGFHLQLSKNMTILKSKYAGHCSS